MSSEFSTLRLEQLQASLNAYAALRAKSPPFRDWLKEIREALSITVRQQAAKLGVAAATLHKSEQAEADERITLGQLLKAADSLDCELVYLLVPRKSLIDVVQDRAKQIAKEWVYVLAHKMSLEDQRPTNVHLQTQVTRRAEELMREKWSNLWR